MTWRKDAACKGAKTDLFFANDEGEYPDLEQALAFCNACTVRQECLDHAFLHREYTDETGIYGGLTPRQRRTLRRTKSRRNE